MRLAARQITSAASAGRGMNGITGPSSSAAAKHTSPQTRLLTGVRAPLVKFSAERVRLPLAGTPPANAQPTFAIPLASRS